MLSGPSIHECLASCPHAFVRPITCPNPSHTYRIGSSTPRRMSPCDSCADTMITLPMSRMKNRLDFFKNVLRMTLREMRIVTLVVDVALLNIDVNICK